MGYGCTEADDPYEAMAELCRRPMVYRAMILSLASFHREELALIPAVKRRFPHVEVWLTHTDGRQASLAEAMRLGADGLLSGEGLHRIAVPAAPTPGTAGAPQFVPAPMPEAPVSLPRPAPPREESKTISELTSESPTPETPREEAEATVEQTDEANAIGEPVLTADELRALLQEQPAPPSPGEA
jgi:DNA-binding NarL/FixJ family response regulator